MVDPPNDTAAHLKRQQECKCEHLNSRFFLCHRFATRIELHFTPRVGNLFSVGDGYLYFGKTAGHGDPQETSEVQTVLSLSLISITQRNGDLINFVSFVPSLSDCVLVLRHIREVILP